MPTYEPGYYYTVNIYEFINDNLGSGNTSVETTDAVDADGWTEIYAWNSNPLISGDWLSPDNGKLVNYDHKLKYEVRVWKQTAPGLGPNPVGILGDDDGVKVFVLQSWLNSIASYASCPKSFGNYVRQSSPISGKGNTVFTFFIDGIAPGPITPKLKVVLEGESQENPNNPEEVEIGLANNAKMKTVNLSKTKTDPKIPTNLKTLVGSDRARWNTCTNEWVGLLLTNVSNGLVDTTLVYFSKKGEEKRRTYLGRESATATGPNTIFGRGQQALLEAVQSACGETNAPGTPDPGDLLPPDADKIRYNPPNHFVTRSVAHGERTRESFERNSIITNVVGAQEALSTRNRRLGKIYQSEDGAAALNKPTKGEIKFWGFKFSYNPQSIQYSTAVDTSIDWMLNSKDPANLLGGNTQVSIQLYLNRIADMTELKKWNKAKASDYGTNYPRALRKEEIEGILYRGTEYDLEFLYRVLNGDPGKTALLEYDGQTADFGYITGTPCWFHLHNNMRYYGSMANVSVNHVMFTQEMVPMLSTVDISFIRYPSLEFASPAQQREAILNAAKNLGGTGEEAKK